MGGVIGLDVGGANTKAVWRDGDERRAVSRPFEVWRDREALAAVLREVVAGVAPEPVEAGGADHDRRALGRVPHQARGRGLRARRRRGGAAPARGCSPSRRPASSSPSPRRGRAPLEVAAANWVASALAVAALYPDALMIDVGSTTVDVDPDRRRPGGRRRPHRPRPAAGRRARLHRRAAHQPRGDRAARAGARRLVPGRLGAVRDQRRRAPDPRPPRARRLHVRDPGRAARDRRVRARARGAARVRRRRAARARRRSTRSPRTCTRSRCARSRRRCGG